MQLDIEKAYDSVDREAMRAYFERVGLTASPFYHLMETAMTEGQVYVTGPAGLASPFLTSRGIRQGCPVSPILFTFLLMGL